MVLRSHVGPVAALVALVLAAAVGCGGGDGNGSSGGEPSAADYRREANALCRQSERDAKRLAGGLSGPEGLPNYFARAAKLSEKYDAKARALRPPPELRREHEEFERSNTEGTRYLRGLSKKFRETDDPAATFRSVLPGLIRLVEKGNRLARRMGLKDCVEDLRDLQAQPDPSQS